MVQDWSTVAASCIELRLNLIEIIGRLRIGCVACILTPRAEPSKSKL